MRLTQLIASMVGPTGKIAIEGFYDDVLPFAPTALKMMQEVPDDSESMRQWFGLGSTDGAASSLQEGLVRIRTLGGGVAAGPFIETFHLATLGVSLANYDDNQHTDNENLRLGNLWNGIATLASIMTAN